MIVSAPAWAFASWIAARRVQVAPAVAHLPSPGAASTASVVSLTVNVAAAAGATASNSAATPRRKRLTGAMEGGEDECPVRGRLSRLSERRGAACNCVVVSGVAYLTIHWPSHGCVVVVWLVVDVVLVVVVVGGRVVVVVLVVVVVVVGGRVVVVELVVVDVVVLVVVVGNGSVDRCSNAPMSHRPPEGCGRDTPR